MNICFIHEIEMNWDENTWVWWCPDCEWVCGHE